MQQLKNLLPKEQAGNLAKKHVLIPTPEQLSQPPSCPDCGGVGYVRVDVLPNHHLFGKPLPCNNEVHNDDRLRSMAKVSGLLPDDLGKTLADILPNPGNQAMLDAAQEMIEGPFGFLYIWGGPGNAKSEVLIALVNEMRKQGKKALYTKFSKIVGFMRDAFTEQERKQKGGDIYLGYIERFDLLKSIDFLAIDEMGKARNTNFVNEFRFDFLDDRYRQAISGQTVTIFADNTNPNSLDDTLWDRIRDGRFKVIENTSGSSRPFMRRET